MSQLVKIALVKWNNHDELALAIADELERLDYCPHFFLHNDEIPTEANIVFTFGPYGRFLPIARQVGTRPLHSRPLLVHWNFEGSPNRNLPWVFIQALSTIRSGLDGIGEGERTALGWLDKRMLRFRYLGDYRFAYAHGWLHALASISPAIAQFYTQHGLPTQFIAWGTSPNWYADLKLERDIDVLWFGKRRNARRGALIDRVRETVEQSGYRMMVVDGVEHPFIFGAERTRMLNRARIVLNVKTTEQSNGFTFRFHMVAGNRPLVVSEAFVPQSTFYQHGVHFVSAPLEQLAETVIYYLEHEDERRTLAENAYELVTNEMALNRSVLALMQHVERVWGKP